MSEQEYKREVNAQKKTIAFMQRTIDGYRQFGVPEYEKMHDTIDLLKERFNGLYSKRHEIARHYQKRLASYRHFVCPKCIKELWEHGENGECPQFCKECGREMEK